MKRYIMLVALFAQSCAYVHHVQVGDIENKKGFIKRPFEMKVSETGVDFQQAASLVNAVSRDRKVGQDAKRIADIIALFQMGPRTGKPVFNDVYADSLAKSIYEKCPSGEITGLVMIREMNSYPVVSGEIVKIKGYCLERKS